ncbi:MAG: HAD-IIIA family hydrolase [Proteobacteria bacterium]|nr:MAG: HAD-IIIA family hydrolase [Pseudomonadota bacterium]
MNQIHESDKNIEGFGDQSCLFLDRDGVIVPDIPYNTDIKRITLKPGIDTLIAKAHALGHWVVIVSNQSGLGRGYFSWTDYRRVHQKICALLADKGQWVDLALCAPYYDGTEFAQAKARPHFRKPALGMFEHAQQELGIAFTNSIMIGDSATDLMPAFQCGIKKIYLVDSDKKTGEVAKLAEYQQANPQFQYKFITEYTEVGF